MNKIPKGTTHVLKGTTDCYRKFELKDDDEQALFLSGEESAVSSKFKNKDLDNRRKFHELTFQTGDELHIEYYDFGYDTCGNCTSHYTIWHNGKFFYKTSRRQQGGNSGGTTHDLAECRINDFLIEGQTLVRSGEIKRTDTHSRHNNARYEVQ